MGEIEVSYVWRQGGNVVGTGEYFAPTAAGTYTVQATATGILRNRTADGTLLPCATVPVAQSEVLTVVVGGNEYDSTRHIELSSIGSPGALTVTLAVVGGPHWLDGGTRSIEVQVTRSGNGWLIEPACSVLLPAVLRSSLHTGYLALGQPYYVTFAAEETGTKSVYYTPINYPPCHGRENITITGRYYHPYQRAWLTATTALEVIDPDCDPVLELTVSPTGIAETAGAHAATATITRHAKSYATSVTVALASSDVGEATVPATVTIPANASTATFPVAAVSDNLLDGPQTVTLTASAPDYADASTTVTVVGDDRVIDLATDSNNDGEIDLDDFTDEAVEDGQTAWYPLNTLDVDGNGQEDYQQVAAPAVWDPSRAAKVIIATDNSIWLEAAACHQKQLAGIPTESFALYLIKNEDHTNGDLSAAYLQLNGNPVPLTSGTDLFAYFNYQRPATGIEAYLVPLPRYNVWPIGTSFDYRLVHKWYSVPGAGGYPYGERAVDQAKVGFSRLDLNAGAPTIHPPLLRPDWDEPCRTRLLGPTVGGWLPINTLDANANGKLDAQDPTASRTTTAGLLGLSTWCDGPHAADNLQHTWQVTLDNPSCARLWRYLPAAGDTYTLQPLGDAVTLHTEAELGQLALEGLAPGLANLRIQWTVTASGKLLGDDTHRLTVGTVNLDPPNRMADDPAVDNELEEAWTGHGARLVVSDNLTPLTTETWDGPQAVPLPLTLTTEAHAIAPVILVFDGLDDTLLRLYARTGDTVAPISSAAPYIALHDGTGTPLLPEFRLQAIAPFADRHLTVEHRVSRHPLGHPDPIVRDNTDLYSQDTLALTAVSITIDLDMDSDNTGTVERSPEEDAAEDAPGSPAQPGVQVLASTGDADGDGLPDFADGLVELGTADARSSNHALTPVLLELPLLLPPTTRIRFRYSGSDPAGVAVTGDSTGGYYCQPATGALRLWRTDQLASRSSVSVADGGDYLPPDAGFTVAQLGEPLEAPGHFGMVWRFYVEAVSPSTAPGDQSITVELALTDSPTEAVSSDTVRLTCLGVSYSVGLDEPYLDGAAVRDGFVLIPADDLTVDVWGSASHVDIGVAGLRLPAGPMVWSVLPDSANLGCGAHGQPKLADRSLEQPVWYSRTLPNAAVSVGIAEVAFDFTFSHPGGDGQWAKAGDRFTVRVTGPGIVAPAELKIEIVPGRKYFHVTQPPTPPAVAEVWAMSDAAFKTAYETCAWIPTTNSGEVDTLRVYCYDQFRNPLEKGTAVTWSLDGAGFLGVLNPDDDEPDTSQQYAATVGNYAGLAGIVFTQDRYPNCPWQANDTAVKPSKVWLTVDGFRAEANISLVEREQQYSPPILKIAQAGYVGYEDRAPDLYTGDTVPFYAVVVTRDTQGNERPLAGAKVTFTSLNGALDDTDGIVETDADGIATINLLADRAREGKIDVIAAISTERAIASGDLAWFSSASFSIKPRHRILIGDELADGQVAIESLTGWESIAFAVASQIDLSGEAGQRYAVQASKQTLDYRRRAYYTFEHYYTDDLGRSRGFDEEQDNDAIMEHHSELGEVHVAIFDGATDRVVLPSAEAVSFANGCRLSFDFRPDEIGDAMLFQRPGQYSVALLHDEAAGTLRLAVTLYWNDGSATPVLHTVNLQASEWYHAKVLYHRNAVRISVGSRGDFGGTQDTFVYGLNPQWMPGIVTADVLVGESFVGAMDNIAFEKPTPGAGGSLMCFGLSHDGYVTMDDEGTAQLDLISTGSYTSGYQAETYTFSMTPEVPPEGAAAPRTTHVQVAPKQLFGNLMAIGRAFVVGTDGLSDNATPDENAAAWASEVLPLAADLRTLAFEAYKAASGCDEVSKLNIAFSVAGLVLDAVSLGSGGTALRASRLFLKELAQGLVVGMPMFLASEFVQKLTEQIASGNPPAWVEDAVPFLQFLAANMERYGPLLADICRGFDGIFDWLNVYKELGEEQTRFLFDAILDLGI